MKELLGVLLTFALATAGIVGACHVNKAPTKFQECEDLNGIAVSYGNHGSTLCESPKTREILFKIN